MIKVVEILRLSTDEQFGNGHVGILRQKEDNQRTIDKYKLKRHHTIELVDVSGTAVTKTPEIQNLVELIRSQVIKGIVIADMDRLCRFDDFRDFALFQEFIENNVLIYTADSVIDMNLQSGFLLGGLQSIISSNELTQIKKRMIRAKEIKRKQGKHPNNDLSLPIGIGYDRKSERYYYNEESLKITELFNLFYYHSIHNYRELERRTGIHHRTIFNLLQNKLFIGVREYTHKRSKIKNIKSDGRQGDRDKVLRTKDEHITNQVIDEPLIPPPIFYNIQKTIRLKNKHYHKKRYESVKRFKYSSLLKCGYCDNKIYHAASGYIKHDYYTCSSKRIKNPRPCNLRSCRRSKVDFSIDKFLFDKMFHKTFIDKLVGRTIEGSTNVDITTSRIEFDKKLTDLKVKKEKLIDLYLDGVCSKEQLNQKLTFIEKSIDEIQAQLDTFNTFNLMRDKSFISTCLNNLSSFLNDLKDQSWDQVKTALMSVINFIKITNDSIAGLEINLPALCNNLCIHTGRDSWRLPA